MWTRALIASVALWFGCSDTALDLKLGSCRAMAESYVTCMAPELDRNALEKHCTRYAVDFEALRACGLETNCNAFTTCVTSFREQSDPERRKKRLEDYIDARKTAESESRYSDAEAACNALRSDPDPIADELKACDTLAARAAESYRAKMQLLRDLPRTRFGHLSLCAEYQVWAEKVSPDAKETAIRLCREAEISIEVFAIVREIRQRIKDQDDRVPPHCKKVISDLQTLATEWSKSLVPVVLDACYVKMGKRVLASHTADKCSVDSRRILAAAATYQALVAAPLGARLKRVKADCK